MLLIWWGKAMETEHKFKLEMTSMLLHLVAMLAMLCDHLWATVIPGNQWLTCLGRLAYPIFAFMIVEGYFHTRNLRRYVLRLFLFAIISEIPFNLMYSASPVYPYHQNVIWTYRLPKRWRTVCVRSGTSCYHCCSAVPTPLWQCR